MYVCMSYLPFLGMYTPWGSTPWPRRRWWRRWKRIRRWAKSSWTRTCASSCSAPWRSSRRRRGQSRSSIHTYHTMPYHFIPHTVCMYTIGNRSVHTGDLTNTIVRPCTVSLAYTPYFVRRRTEIRKKLVVRISKCICMYVCMYMYVCICVCICMNKYE